MSVPEMTLRQASAIVTVIPTAYDRHGGDHYWIAIECADFEANRWAIRWKGTCLSDTNEWEYEPFPSERTPEWFTAHRFSLEEAITRASRLAPFLRVNGRDPQQFMDYIDAISD